MRELYPLLIVGGVIGLFAVIFTVAFFSIKNRKEAIGFDRHMKDSEIIRRLLVYARPYALRFVFVFCVMLFSIVYDIVAPLLIGSIEEMISDEFTELAPLFSMVAVYAGILIVSLICTYVQAIVLQKTGQKIISRIREDVFVHIEGLSHAQLNTIPVGTLVTRVTNDTAAISMMFTNLLVNLFKNCLLIVSKAI